MNFVEKTKTYILIRNSIVFCDLLGVIYAVKDEGMEDFSMVYCGHRCVFASVHIRRFSGQVTISRALKFNSIKY